MNNKLSKIIYPEVEVNGELIKGNLSYDFISALDVYQSAKIKFQNEVGEDITDEVKRHFVNVLKTTSDTSGKILYILFGGIGITLFLLICIFFAGLYWYNDQNTVFKCFFLAVTILVLAVLIMYLWIQDIYNDTSEDITCSCKNINILSEKVKNAIITVILNDE